MESRFGNRSFALDLDDRFDFYGPELLLEEIERYSEKLMRYTKIDLDNFYKIKTWLLDSINIIEEELISNKSWKEAFELVKDVDVDDTPFVALAIQLNCQLWTGDKKLAGSIYHKNEKLILNTQEVLKLL
ncbi:PIN domain-containing protein [Flavimarina sp. Hel_I_48]|uniref:PIN domain-containing protein n=1 Tax=Flavimarina sp. Hel_I_48 TaxID=1392488 RepID=UPI0009DDA5E7